MTANVGPAPAPVAPTPTPAPTAATRPDAAWRRVFRDHPIVPLSVLLVALIVVLELVQPGTIGLTWAGFAIRAAIPLAILAGCQTLAMLTGGIDLSIGMIGSMAALLVATQSTEQGAVIAVAIGLVAATVAGVANGVGIGIFKVHPLIMTLGTGLLLLGLMAAYQGAMTNAGTELPAAIVWLGQGLDLAGLPNSLLVFVPIAALILFGLRSTGYGRLLFAIGDNPVASRLAGARIWQILVVLYVISALLAAVAGLLVAGLVNTATVSLVEVSVLPSVAAAVIGGTSIMGGRGGYAGTIVGAMILTVLTALLTALSLPEAVREMLFGLIIVAVAAAYSRLTAES
jgi:ribose transport system permease protein